MSSELKFNLKLFVLAYFFGWLGADRFYVGKKRSGFLKFITLGGGLIWWIVDLFLIATGQFKNADGEVVGKSNVFAVGFVFFVAVYLAYFGYNAYGIISETRNEEYIEAENSIVYGDPVVYGGETYETVVIGTQTWLKRNLNYKPAKGNSRCYEDNPANCQKYGRLYGLATAKKACPANWHLPSSTEWDRLYRYVDGDKSTESPYISKTAGKYLKATSGWNDNNGQSGNGTDAFGFAALPSGGGNSKGNFGSAGYFGYWWAASDVDTFASRRIMGYLGEDALFDIQDNTYLFSVRCVKD